MIVEHSLHLEEQSMSQGAFRNVFLLAATLVGGAVAANGNFAYAEDRPFEARWDGNAHLSETGDPCIVRNDETGEGEATHLGRFTWSSVEFVDFCAVEGGVAVEGSFTMTAADGDLLFGTYETVGLFGEDGNLHIEGSFEFTGGTGRFTDATGSGDLEALAFLSPGLPFIGHFEGTIDY
jgi:hypothetical protein